MEPKVAVIIPYYQKEKGLLRRAVSSVLAQTGFASYEIIIVDDSSPIPAHEDLNDVLETHGKIIKIIKQKNAGPAIARNSGLDAVSKETEYVAFLDSDDAWKPSHLENAIMALGKGYDLYFASVLNHDGKISLERFDVPGKHRLLDKQRNLLVYTGDLFNDILLDNFIATSAAVYRYKKYANQRFRKELFILEDKVFWLDLLLSIKEAVFSINVGCVMGAGINIWHGANRWGSKDRVRSLSVQIWAYKYILSQFTLNLNQRVYIETAISDLRYEITVTFLHDIRQQRWRSILTLLCHLGVDPLMAIYIFPNCVRAYKDKQKKR